MNQELVFECKQTMEARAAFYRLMASLFYRELSDEDLARLSQLRVDEDDIDEEMAEGFAKLRRWLALRGPDARTDLAVDFARALLAAGVYEGDAACPYASIYTSEDGLMMQESRDEVRAAYRRHGMALSDGVHEPEDHISFEFEFLALLADKAAEVLSSGDEPRFFSLVRESSAFIGQQVLNWMGVWGERLTQCADQGFYPAVFAICHSYVRNDRALLEQLAQLAPEGDPSALAA